MSPEAAGSRRAEGTYDAFLSYAHEDEETAAWLHKLLSRYWVPGKPRRRIFHDQQHVTAHSLSRQITRALENSAFLIVCWSASARESSWVPDEIAHFLAAHPDAVSEQRVLVCWVGPAEAEPPPLPEALRDLTAGSLFIPDLRGRPARARGKAKRRYAEAALALLAVLIGLGDKEQVLRRRRRRLLQWTAAASAIVLAAAGALAGRQWWLNTPPGLFHQSVQRVLIAARTEQIADSNLFDTARALGSIDRPDLVEGLAGLAPEGPFKDLILVAGYASVSRPDCDRVEKLLTPIDHSAAHSWPAPLLLAARPCGEEWIGRALESSPEPELLLRDAERLARYGHPERAMRLIERKDFPANGIVPLRVYIGLATGEDQLAASPSEIEAWIEDQDGYDQLGNPLDLLEELDAKSLLGTPLAGELLRIARMAAGHLDNNLINTWDLKQQLAAHLVAAGQTAEANELLEATARGLWTPINEAFWNEAVVGWAWRGLALHRLGQPGLARDCFEQAERNADFPLQMSRSWDEWIDLATVFVLADDWQRAFRATERPQEERARLRVHFRMIELWIERRRLRTRKQAARIRRCHRGVRGGHFPGAPARSR